LVAGVVLVVGVAAGRSDDERRLNSAVQKAFGPRPLQVEDKTTNKQETR
jgi:hypothetical protein